MRKLDLNEIGPIPVDANEGISPLVTIAVPVYNTPIRYLRRCLESLYEQTYQKLEILIVDDGSDSSHREALYALAKEDDRVRVFETGHDGVSHARNVAISQASGEWIAFSDADDVVSRGFVDEALRIALALGVDIVCGKPVSVFCNSKASFPAASGAVWVFGDDSSELDDLADEMLSNHELADREGPVFGGRGPVAKLYRSCLAKEVLFNESVDIGEDTLFNYQYLLHSKAVALAELNWYQYYQYADSSMRTDSLERWKRSIEGVIEDNRPDSPKAPHCVRCAFMSAQGIESFSKGMNLVAAIKPSRELIRFAYAKGCFEERYFERFALSRYFCQYVALCRAGRFTAAAIYWLLRSKVVATTRRQKLFSLEEGDS